MGSPSGPRRFTSCTVPSSKEYPETEYAMVTFKGIQEEGKKGYGWFEESVTYPYKPGTAVQPVKPVDDGHGHAH